MGRVAEQAHLESFLRDAKAGRGRIVSLQGEPGAGKTRLARWLTPRAAEEGFRVAWGVCAHADRAPPFSPWTQILRKFLASHERALPAHLGVLHAVVPELPVEPVKQPQESRHARFVLFSAVQDLLREITRDGPVVVMLDDVHDADTGSLSLLVHLLPHLHDLPVLVVCTRRTSGARRTPEKDELIDELSVAWGEIPLGPLSPACVAACIEAMTGAAPAPELVTQIVHRTGGNAFFVDRVVRGLVARGRLTDEIPASVRALISRRLRALGEHATSVLAALAILESPAAPSLVAAIADKPLGAVLAVFDAAQADGMIDTFVDGAGDVAFRHELVRLSIQNSLAPLARAQLYASAAKAIAPEISKRRPERTAQLARLWSGAALLGPEFRREAFEWARRAGQRAWQVTSFETAADWFERAVALGAPPDQAPRLLVDLGQAQLASGRMVAARATFLKASQHGEARDDHDVVADAALGFARTGDGAFVDLETIKVLRSAADQLPVEELEKRAMLLSTAAQALWTDPSYHALAEELSMDALVAARQSGHRETLITVLDGRLAVNGGPDGLPERLEALDELSDLMDGVSPDLELRARRWRLNALLQTGRTQEAREEVAAYVACAEQTRLPQFLYKAALRRCFHPFLRGDFSRAIVRIDEAREAGRRAGDVHADAAWSFGRGMVAFHDETAEVEPFLAELERQAQRLIWLPPYQLLYGSVLLWRGETNRARQALKSILSGGVGVIAMNMLTLPAFALLGQVAERLEDVSLGREVLQAQLPYVDQAACTGAYLPMGSVAGHLGRLAAFLGDPRAASWSEQGQAMNAQMDGRPWLRSPAAPEKAAPVVTSSASVPAAPRGVGPGIRVALRSSGEVLTLETQGRVHHLKRRRGWDYIETLLRSPGEDHSAADLAGVAIELRDEGAGPALDEQAKRMYRARVTELRAELAEAEDFNDVGRTERARTELEFLMAELSGAIGLSGRDRSTHSAVERARSSVTRAIRRVTRSITEVEPELGRQLNAAIRTGHDCRYDPSELLDLHLE